jgi:drug/metabolite transporter (DMT)-like permease
MFKPIQTAVVFGFVMALIDVFVLTALRLKHEQPPEELRWVLYVAFLVYGLQSVFFYKALDYNGLVVMNMLWDILSDILVSIVGFVVFKEVLSDSQIAGLLLGVLSVFLLSRP